MNTENTSDTSRNTSNEFKSKLDKLKAAPVSVVVDQTNYSEHASTKRSRFFWFWVLVYSAIIFFGAYHFIEKGGMTLSVIMLLCAVFIHIYTASIELPPLDGADPVKKREFEESNHWQRQKWMIFAYGFMLFSLLMTFYPFVVPYGSHDGKSADEYLETIRERPIALFIGYSVNSKDKHSDHSQVLQPTVHEQPDSAMAPNEDAKAEINSPDAKRNGSGIKIQAEWIINIGGYVEACATDPNRNNGVAAVCSVSGGLQVPLYFIILALMGGSISLTRRLPELQKMASSAYVATENQPKLSQHEFREYLIFHIVQFISAPFLAILAYYLVEPSNTANSVALAFIAGFASESILLMIRSVAEKISPKTTDTTQYGTITGVVTLVQTDKTMRPATKAEVSLVDLPHVTTLTDEQGLYVLGNVPVGMNNIRVVCTGAKEKTDSVKIEHSQAVVRKNVTVEA